MNNRTKQILNTIWELSLIIAFNGVIALIGSEIHKETGLFHPLSSIVPLLSSLWIYDDARKQQFDHDHSWQDSPLSLAIATAGVWIIAFPYYLLKKTHQGNVPKAYIIGLWVIFFSLVLTGFYSGIIQAQTKSEASKLIKEVKSKDGALDKQADELVLLSKAFDEKYQESLTLSKKYSDNDDRFRDNLDPKVLSESEKLLDQIEKVNTEQQQILNSLVEKSAELTHGFKGFNDFLDSIPGGNREKIESYIKENENLRQGLILFDEGLEYYRQSIFAGINVVSEERCYIDAYRRKEYENGRTCREKANEEQKKSNDAISKAQVAMSKTRGFFATDITE